MESVASWLDKAGGSMSAMVDVAVAYLPNLIGAVILLAIGWIVARVVRGGANRIGGGLNRLLLRFTRRGSLARVQLSGRVLDLIGDFAFWLVILFFVTVAAKTARLDTFSFWLDRIVAYLPTLFAGALIVFGGYLISALVRDLVSGTLASAGVAHSATVGAAAQGATFLTGLIIGIDQVGIDVSFLITIIAIVLGTALAGVSLAFGLGAKDLVGNLIGAHYLRQVLQPGQTARIGGFEGEIVELTPTNVVLAIDGGQATVPAKLFNQEATVLMSSGRDDD